MPQFDTGGSISVFACREFESFVTFISKVQCACEFVYGRLAIWIHFAKLFVSFNRIVPLFGFAVGDRKFLEKDISKIGVTLIGYQSKKLAVICP